MYLKFVFVASIYCFCKLHKLIVKVSNREDAESQAAERLGVRLKAGSRGLKFEFCCDILYDPSKNAVSWTLDRSQKSDIHRSDGYWYVASHPDNPDWARVHYSTEIKLGQWIPKIAANMITRSAMSEGVRMIRSALDEYTIRQSFRFLTPFSSPSFINPGHMGQETQRRETPCLPAIVTAIENN